MAAPLSSDRLVQALRDEGLVVLEYRNWRSHNRNHRGAWGPINGVMIHHTVTSGTESSVRLCYDGYSALPGPLCHGVIDKAGEVWLVGNGRANHAGLGDDNVLADVIAERELSPDNEASTDGNARFYGFECINMGDGEDPWPDAQLEAIEKAAAAICRAYGWNERSVIGHLEWQPGKVDPRGFSMHDMRARISHRLSAPPSQQHDQEDDMPTVEEIVEGVAKTDGIFDVPARWREDNPTNEEWQLESILAHIGDRVYDVRDIVTSLTTQVTAQQAVLEKLADAVGQAGDFDPAELRTEIRAAITEAVESVTATVRLDVNEEGTT